MTGDTSGGNAPTALVREQTPWAKVLHFVTRWPVIIAVCLIIPVIAFRHQIRDLASSIVNSGNSVSFPADAVGALLGIVGVGVGILLALFPAHMVAMRDAYKTLASALNLVGLELGYCDRICDDRKKAVADVLNALSQSQPVLLPLFNYFPTAAWTALWHLPTVLNDFPVQLHAFIARLYGELDLGNRVVDHATLVAANVPYATPHVTGSMQTMFTQHASLLDAISEHLALAFPRITAAEKRARLLYRIAHAAVWALLIAGVVSFLYFLRLLWLGLQNGQALTT
jgi:hypothetical protein